MLKQVSAVTLIVFSLACSEGFNSVTSTMASGGGRGQGAVNGALLPATDKIDSSCMVSPDYDACLFNKNPVYHSGRTMSGTAKSQIEPYQNLGVKLIGVGAAGTLDNSDFWVGTLNSPRISTANSGQLKVRVSQATGTEIEQLMTYYYFNSAFAYWASRGGLAARQKGLKVIVDDRVTGFRKENNQIHLARLPGQWPAALDASQSLYLLGTANLYHASGGEIFRMASGDAAHVSCGTDAKGCCATANGCSRALVSGLSSYFVAAMFPSGPAIGELAANRLKGLRVCNVVDRDLSGAAGLTKALSYSACTARRGDVHVMGNLYASVFWEVRKRMVNDQIAVDRLYLEHLTQLNGDDTFVTAKAKLLSLGSGVLTPALRLEFAAEFQRRGI